MKKFFAVIRHEYKKIILKWSFLLGTLLLPVLAAGSAVIPALIFSISGEPTRIAVVDNGGQLAARLRENLSAESIAERTRDLSGANTTILAERSEDRPSQVPRRAAGSFIVIDYPVEAMDITAIRRELAEKISAGEFDAYLIVPASDASPGAAYEFRSRKAGDFIANDTFKDALNMAVRSERLAAANINEAQLKGISRDVNLDVKGLNELGEEKNTDSLMAASFAIGLMIYITLAIYGQAIMAAVVEEKETRIAEILFSSTSPFILMAGKLVGVGIAGLTQLAIWLVTAAGVVGYLAVQTNGPEIFSSLPTITAPMISYFLIFFLLGYFAYASIFALIGSMVTTVQEGGQFAFPPIMILLVGFYFSFAVVRDPNSTLSFWVSIAPFFAPITMPLRILAETPPLWQIGLAVIINAAAIAGLVWLASRVYRVGMLIYGKRATIPEVFKWIRQA